MLEWGAHAAAVVMEAAAVAMVRQESQEKGGKGRVSWRFCIPLGRARRGGAGEPRRYGWRVKDGHVTGQ